MAVSRNIPIDIAKGTSKRVTVVSQDEPNLIGAEIILTIKMHAVDLETVLIKAVDTNASPDLATGTFAFTFEPADTSSLIPRTYVYEVKVIIGENVYIPLIGDFNIFSTIT